MGQFLAIVGITLAVLFTGWTINQLSYDSTPGMENFGRAAKVITTSDGQKYTIQWHIGQLYTLKPLPQN